MFISNAMLFWILLIWGLSRASDEEWDWFFKLVFLPVWLLYILILKPIWASTKPILKSIWALTKLIIQSDSIRLFGFIIWLFICIMAILLCYIGILLYF